MNLDFILNWLLGTVLVADLFFFALLGAGILWEKYDAWKNPVYPSCDINPLCHPAFVLDKDGGGWIGKVRISGDGTMTLRRTSACSPPSSTLAQPF